MKVKGAYFSPSGGTRRAVELICGLFGPAELLDLGGRERSAAHYGPDELLVLGLPVYAGQMPAIPGLLDGLRGENTPCIIVAAYGNRHYDDTLAQMKRRMGAQGFRCVGGAAVVTPHIFAPTLGAGRPDEEDMAVLTEFARGVREKLDQLSWAEADVPGDPEPVPRPAVPVKKDRDWDICLGCGFCAQVCPTGAMDQQTLLWDMSKCISCMACAARCPVGALGYNSSALASRLTEKFSQRRPVEIFLDGEG